VTKFTFYWEDFTSSGDGDAKLYRTDMANTLVPPMASVSTSGNSSVAQSSATTSISNSGIDNSRYAYYVYLNLPYSDISIYGIVIEYTIDRPY